jgi:retron-type reverse transcriptase
MSAPAERSVEGQGETLSAPGSDETHRPRPEAEDTGPGLLSAVLARENMQQAWKRVRSNKGAAGIDGLAIDETAERLMWEWPVLREQLLHGTYRPQPVRRVMIPKPDGGERELGIPMVTDRLIQQALLQVLQPLLDPTFSQHSYGFRPGRSAQQAVQAAQGYVQSGRRVVVDVDLEKFLETSSYCPHVHEMLSNRSG